MVSRPPRFEPNGSKEEDFGLETEPTSATRRDQMKFQLGVEPVVSMDGGLEATTT